MQKSIKTLLVLGSTLMVMGLGSAAMAQTPGDAVYVATYVDVASASQGDGLNTLKAFRDWGRKEDGNLEFDVVQEIGRANRFVLLTTWKDGKSFETHSAAAQTKQFHDKIDAIRNAPIDERVNSGMTVGPMKSKPGKGAIYVVTHVDVIPPKKDDAIAALNLWSGESRKDGGAIRFNVLQQTSRSNHFTLSEIWKSRKAFEKDVSSAPTKAFRDKLAPIGGALYDERLYKILD